MPRSPLLWYNELCSSLKSLGLEPVPETPCLFVNDKLLVFFYVDDICVLCHPSNHKAYETFKDSLLSIYNMHDLGELEWFLGIRVVRDRDERKIWLCQDTYAEKVAHKFNRVDTNIKPPRTPMSTESMEKYAGEATKFEVHHYQSRVGSTGYGALESSNGSLA